MLTYQVLGVQDCLHKLQAVDRCVGKRIIRKGVRRSVQVAAKRGKSDVPIGETKLLKKSLGWKMLRQRSGVFKAAGMVGARTKVFKRVINGRTVDPGKYAHLVDQGTKPHTIAPKNKARLAFISKETGQLVVVRGVQHPGTRPTRFLAKIRAMNTSGMSRAFRDTVASELLIEAAKARPSEVDDGT